jgi:hypothetical protein
LVGATTIVALLFGGSWTVFQTQFSSIDKEILTLRETLSITGKVDKDDAGKKFDALDGQISKINDTLRADIASNLISRNEFMQFQYRFESMSKQNDETRERMNTLAARSARTPVEKETIDAIVNALDKQIQLVQGQIIDINRQIAAALIIIDNNAKKTALPP